MTNTTVTDKTTLLSEAIRKAIDAWTVKYPPERRQSAVLPALRIVQESNGGWLSEELMEAVAQYLGMSKIAVYEVATFYSMFELKPVGRHKLAICTNISCMLSGCESVVKHLRQRLAIDFNETTSDGKFTLKEVECLGACANAPAMHVGHQYYENLTPEKIDTILEELK